MPKEYKDLRLKVDHIQQALTIFGISNLKIEQEAVTNITHRVTGLYNSKNVLFRIFVKPKGVTIGFATGQCRETFEQVADEIVRTCSYGGVHNLKTSIPDVGAGILDVIADLLTDAGATRVNQRVTNNLCTTDRWKGVLQDTITLTHYKTGTLLLQGINAHIASVTLASLRECLPETASLGMDINAFSLPATVQLAQSNLRARLPGSHDWLKENVRKQLSSALVMTSATLPLEDYAPVAFPALRGLEGFLKQVYCSAGSNPTTEKVAIGEWFEYAAGKWKLLPIPAQHVGVKRAAVLADGYTKYHAQRHGLFHMAYEDATTRTVASMVEATNIVNEILDFIEQSHNTMHA